MADILFPTVTQQVMMSVADELTMVDNNNDNGSSTSSGTPRIITNNSDPFFFLDEPVQQPETPKDTLGSSILRRGGSSAITTKTSPHISRKMGAMVPKLR